MSTEPELGGRPRSVSAVASRSLRASLERAVARERSLRLIGIEERFASLVVAPAFPAEVVVLAEEAGTPLLAHARTAATAGAAVIVFADVDGDLRRRLDEVGALLVPRADGAERVAGVAVAARRPDGRRRPAGATEIDRPRLSPSERRALAHYAQGMSTVQVAETMGVGYESAKTFLRRVRAKYARVDRPAGRRAELIVRAEEDGIL